uniref:Uncharacterized protein n=1 Tax=Octopus bimaculoides TaxID=37653 RepID=A0A0L8FSR1_OCTBM
MTKIYISFRYVPKVHLKFLSFLYINMYISFSLHFNLNSAISFFFISTSHQPDHNKK